MNHLTDKKVVLETIGTGGIEPPMTKNLAHIGYHLNVSLMITK